MEWFFILIPIILSALALMFYHHKLVWWEIVLPIVVCLATIGIMKSFMVSSLTQDIEYWSEFTVEARHIEDWNEYISQTCYQTVSCGKDCTTQVAYDCSYVDYHPEYWEIQTNIGSVYSISKKEYKRYIKLFGNNTYVNMYRDYHTNDGDMYKTVWNKQFNTIQPFTKQVSYTNKPQAASTVFRFQELDSIKRVGLYEYPDIVDRKQSSCLGCNKKDDIYLQRWNALWGSKHHIKVFVLIFDNQDIEISERQRVYWKGGNKNELVICIDKQGKWSRSFSWCDNKEIEIRTNDIFNQPNLSLQEKINMLKSEIKQDWKLKDFQDFDYIRVPLSNSQMVWIFLIVTFISVGTLIFGIKNDI